jgi:hypothetical protein
MLNLSSNISSTSDKYEIALLDLCRDLVGAQSVALTDNFFDLGGTSLQAFVLIETINSMFSLDLGVLDLVDAESFSDLAAKIRDGL